MNKKILLVLYLLPLALGVFAKRSHINYNGNKNNRQLTVLRGDIEWHTVGMNRKQYETPVGVVYKFYPLYFKVNKVIQSKIDNAKITGPVYYLDKESSLNAICFEIYKDRKEKKKLKRFIVIDFSIRLFPADSKNGISSNIWLRICASAKGIKEVKKIKDLSFLARFGGSSVLSNLQVINLFQTAAIKKTDQDKAKDTIEKLKKNGLIPDASWAFNTRHYPDYQLLPIRIVFDTRIGGYNSLNINGNFRVFDNGNLFQPNFNIRTLGLMMTEYPLDPWAKYKRKLYEVSPVTVFTTDDPSEITKLSKIRNNVIYPYQKYIEDEIEHKKVRFKNPDKIYAYAKEMLKGYDLKLGVGLLKKIAKRDKHIFAMKDLGICYWRGIGVEPSIKTANLWFDRALKYNLPEAFAYKLALLKKYYHRPVKWKSEEDQLKKLYFKIRLHYTDEFIVDDKSYNDLYSFDQSFYSVFMRTVLKNYTLGQIDDVYNYYRQDKLKHISLMHRHLKDTLKYRFYHEKVYKNDDEDWKKYPFYDDSRNANLPANFLFRGYLLVAKWFYLKKMKKLTPKDDSLLREAIKLFERGKELDKTFKISDSLNCALEEMHCRALMNKLTDEDFSEANFITYSDHPLFYLLYFYHKNPQYPGFKEFLNRQHNKAIKIWQYKKTALNTFFAILLWSYRQHHNGMGTPFNFDDKKLLKNFIDMARKSRSIHYKYYRYILNKNKRDNLKSLPQIRDMQTTLNFLVKNKHKKGTYHYINNSFKLSHSAQKKWLNMLQPLCKKNDYSAYFLSTKIYFDIFKLSKNIEQKLLKFYSYTAKLGEHRALYKLGEFYYERNRKDLAAKYWTEFIQRDKKLRLLDVTDPYYEDCKSPVTIIISKQKKWKEKMKKDVENFEINSNLKDKQELIAFLKILQRDYDFKDNVIIIDENNKKIGLKTKYAQYILNNLVDIVKNEEAFKTTEEHETELRNEQ